MPSIRNEVKATYEAATQEHKKRMKEADWVAGSIHGFLLSYFDDADETLSGKRETSQLETRGFMSDISPGIPELRDTRLIVNVKGRIKADSHVVEVTINGINVGNTFSMPRHTADQGNKLSSEQEEVAEEIGAFILEELKSYTRSNIAELLRKKETKFKRTGPQ